MATRVSDREAGASARSRSAGPSRPSAPPQRPRLTSPAPVSSVDGKRAENAQTTLELISAGATMLAMFGGARAATQFQNAKTEKEQAAAQKRGRKAQVMQLDAAAFALHAEGVGQGLAGIAKQNAFVGALVDRLEMVNGVGGVFVSVLPLVYQVMANHAAVENENAFPPELEALGVLPPQLLLEKLQAQNAVKHAKLHAQILRERQEAEAEVANLQEQIASQNGTEVHDE